MEKTAIQILVAAYEKRGATIEHYLLNCKTPTEKDKWQADKVLNDMFLKDLRNSLPFERQQIEAAFSAGGDAEYHSVPIAAADYYNQTFNQPTDDIQR